MKMVYTELNFLAIYTGDFFISTSLLDLLDFLSLLWENRAVDLSPPTSSVYSLAAVTASLQVAKPILCLSLPTVLLHVTLGRPLILFPFGAQVEAMRGFCWLFIRNTCPIQRHLRLLISSLMVQVLARCLTSSSDTFIGQYIFSNLRRHMCRNVPRFAASLFVILQV